MTNYRVSAAHGGHWRDMIVDATDDATMKELASNLESLGFGGNRLWVDGKILPEDMRVVDSPLKHGSQLFGYDSEAFAERRPGWYVVAVAGPDCGRFVGLTEEPLTVGRSDESHLSINDELLSSKHFEVRIQKGFPFIRDLGSRNGTFLEGDKIGDSPTDQALISSQDSSPDSDGEGANNIETFTNIGHGDFCAAGSTVFGFFEVKASDLERNWSEGAAADVWHGRFRNKMPASDERFQHPDRPDERSFRGRIFQMAGPILVSLLGATVMFFLARSDGTGYPSAMLILPLLMILGPLVYSVWQFIEEREAKNKYKNKLLKLGLDVEKARKVERRRDRWTGTPAGLASLLVQLRHRRLWERRAGDEDFGEVALGLCGGASQIPVENSVKENDAGRFPHERHNYLLLRHSFIDHGSLAILGEKQRCRAVTRSLLLDLAASHSPRDLQIWLLCDDDLDAEVEWNQLRWLPHNFDGDASNRVFNGPRSRAAAVSSLRSVVSQRQSETETRNAPQYPLHVIVIDCVDEVDSNDLTDLLESGHPVGVVAITLHSVPKGTRAEFRIQGFSSQCVLENHPRGRREPVNSIEMSRSSFGRSARAMASLRPAGSRGEVQGSTGIIRLVDLLDLKIDGSGVEGILQRWSRGGASNVKIGGLGDRVIEIDLVGDGPHGLVGGTTRSGKTEFLKSLFTALAVANHPNDLSIVIVDFKGGVDHELSAGLPHVIDLSTNHDLDSFSRTIRLIEAEQQRRQREFKKAKVVKLEAYREAQASDKSLISIPRLLVVVDEFSEMLSDEVGKEKLSSLVGVTRVGAGLGVHLLLVTQSFQNQLPPQLEGNASLRICFRVQEESDSRAVLNSGEAASIPKVRIGRAYVRAHNGSVEEFQAARVAGPRPGKEAATSSVKSRIVEFSSLCDPPPPEKVTHVGDEDTDMFAVVEMVKQAAAKTGWTRPVVPWPKELPENLRIGAFAAGEDILWPLGLVDEPEHQRHTSMGLDAYGPHTLLVGGPEARLGEVLRSAVISGAIKRSPEQLHFYVIDKLMAGLSALSALPHVGGVALKDEQLSMRILRHLAAEVSHRKAEMSEVGLANVNELRDHCAEQGVPPPTEVVMVFHGVDRLWPRGDTEPSPLFSPLVSLLAESVGTGIRFLMTAPPAEAVHPRLSASFERRFVFKCADSQDYSALLVSSEFRKSLEGFGRAVDISRGRLVQFAEVPTTCDALEGAAERPPASEVVKAIGWRLNERWKQTDGSSLRPEPMRPLPYPLPIRRVIDSRPPEGTAPPAVALSVDIETENDMKWLDAREDGPVFVVCGSPKSGKSNTLIAAATLMEKQGWDVLGLPLSQRSPMAEGTFPGQIVSSLSDLSALSDTSGPLALFVDDAHKWSAQEWIVDGLSALLAGPGPRAVIVAGPTDSFSDRNDLTRTLGSMRCAMVLMPEGTFDASHFGVRQLSDEVRRDKRPGRGVLVVDGELSVAQVPLALSAESTHGRTTRSVT